MRLRLNAPSDAWEMSDIHPLLASLLADLARSASCHEDARARLYPEPVGESDGNEDLRADWREHVEPELERFFASSREIVSGDLAALGRHGGARLVIPRRNLDAWLNVLNQARLIIAEQNRFQDTDLDHRRAPDLTTRRGMDLLRMHFYAHLQEMLVEAGTEPA